MRIPYAAAASAVAAGYVSSRPPPGTTTAPHPSGGYAWPSDARRTFSRARFRLHLRQSPNRFRGFATPRPNRVNESDRS
uniref:Putative secreted protein n=1 Tax=Anopheles marajoara TaxID=58244 RepID=A0A2M4CBY2_9DIPT